MCIRAEMSDCNMFYFLCSLGTTVVIQWRAFFQKFYFLSLYIQVWCLSCEHFKKNLFQKYKKKKKNQQEKRFPWHTTLLSWQSASTSSFSFFFSIFPYDLALTEKPICGHFDMSGTSWRSLGRRVKRLIVFFLPCAILITYDWPTSKPIVIITLNGP